MRNKFQLIPDLPIPAQASTISNILREYFQVHYDSIDTVLNLVLQFIRQFRKVFLMSKKDTKDAFRKIPVNQKNYHILEFT